MNSPMALNGIAPRISTAFIAMFWMCGSIEVVIGEAELNCSTEVSEGAELDVWRRKSDGKLFCDIEAEMEQQR